MASADKGSEKGDDPHSNIHAFLVLEYMMKDVSHAQDGHALENVQEYVPSQLLDMIPGVLQDAASSADDDRNEGDLHSLHKAI